MYCFCAAKSEACHVFKFPTFFLSLNFTRLHAPLLEDMIASVIGQISLRSPRSELQTRQGHEHLPPLLLDTLEDFVRTFTLDNRTSHP